MFLTASSLARRMSSTLIRVATVNECRPARACHELSDGVVHDGRPVTINQSAFGPPRFLDEIGQRGEAPNRFLLDCLLLLWRYVENHTFMSRL